MLTVYIDFRSPAAYLALEPTVALSEETGEPVRWQPFRSSERPRPTRVADEAVATAHREARARALRAVHEHYARLRGIEMHWPEKPGSADLALAVLATLEADALPFVRAAFDAYWVRNLDLNDAEVIAGLLRETETESQGDPDVLSAKLELTIAEAASHGVVGVPGYRIGDQLFVGREHLPWIRELLCE